jgi:predicted RNase H-like HicB family nuclease
MSIQVRVVYHFEDGAWWADSEDAPGYYAGAATLEQLRERVHEGLEFHFEDSVEVTDEIIEIAAAHRRHGLEQVHQPHRACSVKIHALQCARFILFLCGLLTSSIEWRFRHLTSMDP